MRRFLWPAALGGALAVGVAALLTAWWLSGIQARRLEVLAGEAAVVRGVLERQRDLLGLLGDPATQVLTLRGQPAAPAARASMFWHPRAGGLLVAAGLPAPPAGKAYVLWAAVGPAPPVLAGVLAVGPEGSGSLRVAPLPGTERANAFRVTLEPAGGGPGPTGPLVLAGGP